MPFDISRLESKSLQNAWRRAAWNPTGALEIPGNIVLNSNPPFFLCLNTSFVLTNYKPRQCHVSFNRVFKSDWNLSGTMTLKLVTRQSEAHRPAASSILISRMTSFSIDKINISLDTQ